MSRPRSINALAAVIDGIRNRIASSPMRSALALGIGVGCTISAPGRARAIAARAVRTSAALAMATGSTFSFTTAGRRFRVPQTECTIQDWQGSR